MPDHAEEEDPAPSGFNMDDALRFVLEQANHPVDPRHDHDAPLSGVVTDPAEAGRTDVWQQVKDAYEATLLNNVVKGSLTDPAGDLHSEFRPDTKGQGRSPTPGQSAWNPPGKSVLRRQAE